MKINIALHLTILRITSIPFLVLCFYLPFQYAHLCAALIFLAASLTDWLDGYLARYFSQVTQLGTFLDPVADKLLVSTALVLVISEPYMPYLLSIAAVVIVCREISICALREWMAQIGQWKKVKVEKIAKIKTVLQCTALVILIFYNPKYVNSDWLLNTGVIALYSAALLTLISMGFYLRIAWPELSRSYSSQSSE